jgi:hypothetical protein
MKMLKIFLAAAVCIAAATAGFAQKAKTESFKVSGVCGTCKKTIEKSALAAGVNYANWNIDTRMLTVSYNGMSTNKARIEQKIAEAGYNTPDYKTTDEAYNKLNKCCQYERVVQKDVNCCNSACTSKETRCAEVTECQNKACCKKS